MLFFYESRGNVIMLHAKVKWFNSKRSYGFITGDDGKDYFVYYQDINMPGFKTLEEGQEVTFDTKETDRGISACNVTPITK